MSDLTSIFNQALTIEAQSILSAAKRVQASQVDKAAQLFKQIATVGGQLFICGVGKSGQIAQKLSSTFSSLGLPSYALHPIDALHGDLGKVRNIDAIIFISKSGTTEEILKLLPFVKIPQERRIALVGSLDSPIAQNCDILFDCSVEKEACRNNLAPTSSSTLALAMGDALACLFEEVISLNTDQFAEFHPAGALGKRLLLKASDIMVPKAQCPCLSPQDFLQDALLEMTTFPVGGLAVIDQNNLAGILVEGDIRRTLTTNERALKVSLQEIMTKNPISIQKEDLAVKAFEIMEKREKPLNLLPVLDGKEFIGFIRIHDLWRE